MTDRLKISMVSYINSKPFQLGMELTGFIREIELHLEVPALTAKKLQHNEVDIALVPVAVLPQLNHVEIITNYCIGALKHVDSVLLLSDVPVEEIKTVYLDADSRSSANLIQILLRDYWKKEVNFIANKQVNEELAQGRNACLMIGDKALEARGKTAYEYDLATAWHQMTGLPFVFAVWVANKQGKQAEDALNIAFKKGIADLGQVADFYQNIYPSQNMHAYLSESINYSYDKEKAKALDLFLSKCKQNEVILC